MKVRWPSNLDNNYNEWTSYWQTKNYYTEINSTIPDICHTQDGRAYGENSTMFSDFVWRKKLFVEKSDKYDVCILTKILFTHHRNSEQTQYWDPEQERSYFSSHQISSWLPENKTPQTLL